MTANANPPTPADLLVDALDGLATNLEGRINALPPGSPERTQLKQAQTDLRNAAADIDADALITAITNNADLQKLKDATKDINTTAGQINQSAAAVAKVGGIASAAVALGNAISGGTVGVIIGAVNDLLTAAA